MKRIMILLVMVSLAFSASAALQISIGADQEPADSQYTLSPGQTLNLGIWTDTEVAPMVNEAYFALVCATTDGSVSGGAALEPYADQVDLTLTVYDDAANNFVPVPEGANGVWGGVFSTGGSIPADTMIFGGILFECLRQPNDAVVILGQVDALFSTFTPIDQVVIHQVPEPMTISLLGLGGLLLRRRRK